MEQLLSRQFEIIDEKIEKRTHLWTKFSIVKNVSKDAKTLPSMGREISMS